jgi:hypothetical protein
MARFAASLRASKEDVRGIRKSKSSVLSNKLSWRGREEEREDEEMEKAYVRSAYEFFFSLITVSSDMSMHPLT